jgi:PAS domain-containing protein
MIWMKHMGLQEASLANADILSFPHGSHGRAPHASILEDQRLLHAVLDNMPQGVSMFDAEARLVFCNRRYVEMYGLSAELAKPGCSLLDLLTHRLGARTFSGNPSQYLADLQARVAESNTFVNVVALDDGRSRLLGRQQAARRRRLACHP